MSFIDCLPVILRSEGGFVDDPQDPGGATNLGITLDTLSRWLNQTASVEEVKALTSADVAPIYQALYWNVAHCGDCPSGLDLMVFDEAVNQGPGRAVCTLQAAVGVTADGLFGPATAAAVDAADPIATINAIAAARNAYYRSLTNFPRFGHGWLNRVQTTTDAAIAMVHAAAPAAAGA
jgi:lysozyme family protein